MSIGPSPTATDPHPSSRAAQDVLQNLQYFFGAPVSPEKLKDVSRLPSNLDALTSLCHQTNPSPAFSLTFTSTRSTTR